MAVDEGMLPDLLPIRRILVDGQQTPFVRDVDLSSDVFDIEVDTEEGVVRITGSNVNAVKLDGKDVDAPTPANVDTLLFNFALDKWVNYPANVLPLDAFTFGTEGDHKSYAFRGQGNSDNPFSVDVYTIPDLTSADVTITVVWKRAGTTDTYRRDHRFLIAKNGGTLTEHLQEDGTEEAFGLFSTPHCEANFASGKITMTLTGIADETTSYSIGVQVQETKDV